MSGRHVRRDVRRGFVRDPLYVHEHAYVYGIPCMSEDTRRVHLGYVGQTGRHPHVRLAEHMEDQPWADLIAHPGVFVIWEGSCTQLRLDMIEAMYIAGGAPTLWGTHERPAYNIEHNMDNPDRIPPWTAKERARARGRVVSSSLRASRLSPSVPTYTRTTRTLLTMACLVFLLAACLLAI